MSGQPAIRKVLDAFKALIDGSGDATAYVDRPYDEPFEEDERDAINLRVLVTDFVAFDSGTTLHRCLIEIDIVTNSMAAETIDAQQSEIAAVIVERLHVDMTLGGRCQQIDPQNMSGSAEDGADVGSAILSYLVTFLTPVGDHRTILGQSGPIA